MNLLNIVPGDVSLLHFPTKVCNRVEFGLFYPWFLLRHLAAAGPCMRQLSSRILQSEVVSNQYYCIHSHPLPSAVSRQWCLCDCLTMHDGVPWNQAHHGYQTALQHLAFQHTKQYHHVSLHEGMILDRFLE